MKGGKSKKADSKLTVNKTAVKEKATTYLNKPKRPASAFFIFMEQFRRQYKEDHPHNKSVCVVGKAGGTIWKSMSESEKATYAAKADKRRTDYVKDVSIYKKKLCADGYDNGGDDDDDDDDDPVKSMSEVKEEDEEVSEEELTTKVGISKKDDSKLTVKKTAMEEKASKYPNKPMRPASAYFIFIEEFMKQYKEDHHPDNKSVAAIGKAGGTKWKSMSESEKVPYVAKADKRKKDYDLYNKNLAAGIYDNDDEEDEEVWFDKFANSDVEDKKRHRARLEQLKEQRNEMIRDMKKEKLRLMRMQIEERQKTEDVRFFAEPHDHYSVSVLKVVLARKREIAARWGWPITF